MRKLKPIIKVLFVVVIIFTITIIFYKSAVGISEKFKSYNLYYSDSGNQTQLNISTYNEFIHYDSLLTISYKLLINDLDSIYNKNKSSAPIFSASIKEYKNKLINSHKLWLNVRKSNAETAAFLSEGGTIYPTIYSSQKIQDTKVRIAFYKSLLINKIY